MWEGLEKMLGVACDGVSILLSKKGFTDIKHTSSKELDGDIELYERHTLEFSYEYRNGKRHFKIVFDTMPSCGEFGANINIYMHSYFKNGKKVRYDRKFSGGVFPSRTNVVNSDNELCDRLACGGSAPKYMGTAWIRFDRPERTIGDIIGLYNRFAESYEYLPKLSYAGETPVSKLRTLWDDLHDAERDLQKLKDCGLIR